MARKKSIKQKQKQSQRQSVNVVVHLPETKRRKGRKRPRRQKEPEPSPSFQPGFASLSPIVYQQVLPYPQMAVPEPTPAFRADIKRPILEEMGLKIPPPMTAEQKKQVSDLRATLRDEMKKLAEDMSSAKQSTAVLDETFPSQTIYETPLENPVYTPGEPLLSKRKPSNPIEEAGLPTAFQSEPTDINVYALADIGQPISAVRKDDVELPAKKIPSSTGRWDSVANLIVLCEKILKRPPQSTKVNDMLREIYMKVNNDASPTDTDAEIRKYVSAYRRYPAVKEGYELGP